MNKTPVTMLQEMMAKMHSVPNYDLIHDGGGTHINTFTYKVSCNGFSATGTGRCKKDAKHEAAKAMLETIAMHNGFLPLPASPAQSPIRTPLPTTVPASPRIPIDAPFNNPIGALQDLCDENNLGEPGYILISDVGPPHARVFTTHCVIATFKEEGIATTKKQAKREAAQKMLERIKDVMDDPERSDDWLTKLQSEESRKKDIADEIATVSHTGVCLVPTKRRDLGVKISEYHVKLKNSFDPDTRTEIINTCSTFVMNHYDDDYEVALDAMLPEIGIFLSKLNLELSELEITCKSEDTEDNPQELTIMKINSCPAIVQCCMGNSKAESKFNAVIKVLKIMTMLLEYKN